VEGQITASTPKEEEEEEEEVGSGKGKGRCMLKTSARPVFM